MSDFSDVICATCKIELKMMWLNRNTEVLDSFPPQKWEVNACSMWSGSTQCLSSLTISLVSSISMNDVLIIGGKRFMDRTRSHVSITLHMWTAAHVLISSWKRLQLHFKLNLKWKMVVLGWNPDITRAYSSSLLHAIIACNHLPFLKIFSNFVHFCPNFEIFSPF